MRFHGGMITAHIHGCAECSGKVRWGTEAILCILDEGTVEHTFDQWGKPRDGRWRFIHLLEQNTNGAFPVKWNMPGKDFIEDNAQGIHIGPSVCCFPPGLFGTHVG